MMNFIYITASTLSTWISDNDNLCHIKTALSDVSADEKRRSIADFRDSSFIQTKEKLCVSVKAMSALYLSKVAPQDSTCRPLKPVNI